MKLLLTAFDPFGGEPVNPALEAVKLVSAYRWICPGSKTGSTYCFRQIH